MTTIDQARARPVTAAPVTARAARARRYRPGLDGMRAIAVAAVVAYHLAPTGLLPGGFFGVDIFFVISGYLITSLLAGEAGDTGVGQLLSFWRRRVRRLYPAVVTMIAVVVVLGAAVDPGAVAAARVTVPAALVYVTNWWFIFHHVPYFQAIGRPPLFVHLWSLAIEEQYYLLWPPLLLLLLRRTRTARIALLAVVGAVASTVLMALLYHSGASTDRVYYGSDTHAEGLLIGSALGLVVPAAHLTARVTRSARHLLDAAGVVALAGLLIVMLASSQSATFTWRGGMLLVALLSGVAVVVAVHPASRLSLALGTSPLRWLGTRSYSVYLWHWPILDLTRPHQDVGFGGLPLLVLRVALIAAASELSYRYIERPWRTGTAQTAVRRLVDAGGRRRQVSYGAVTTAVAVVVILLLTARSPLPPPGLRIGQTAAASRPVTPTTAPPATTTTSTVTAPPASVPVVAGTPRGGRVPAGPPPTPPSTVLPPSPGTPALLAAPPGLPVLAIGDSVMLAASTDLEQAFGPAMTVDAAVGRQVDDGLARLSSYRVAGRLIGLRALVVGLGTNGVFDSSQLQQLLQLSRGIPKVILVNVRVPQPWQAASNATIDGAAGRGHVSVIDWYAASGDPSLLYPDAIHPDPAGQVVYSNLVVRAVGG